MTVAQYYQLPSQDQFQNFRHTISTSNHDNDVPLKGYSYHEVYIVMKQSVYCLYEDECEIKACDLCRGVNLLSGKVELLIFKVRQFFI